MNWLDTLLKKLPTLKGITWFLHVATHWSTFRDELEQYRQQIKDRDEWRKTQATMHEAEKQRLAHEFEQKMKATGAAIIEIMNDDIRLQMESASRLAIHYKLNPSEWSVDRERISPRLRAEVEKWMSYLPPPPPAPKTLGEIFGPLSDTPLPLRVPKS
jgi:hypothetical protein